MTVSHGISKFFNVFKKFEDLSISSKMEQVVSETTKLAACYIYSNGDRYRKLSVDFQHVDTLQETLSGHISVLFSSINTSAAVSSVFRDLNAHISYSFQDPKLEIGQENFNLYIEKFRFPAFQRISALFIQEQAAQFSFDPTTPILPSAPSLQTFWDLAERDIVPLGDRRTSQMTNVIPQLVRDLFLQIQNREPGTQQEKEQTCKAKLLALQNHYIETLKSSETTQAKCFPQETDPAKQKQLFETHLIDMQERLKMVYSVSHQAYTCDFRYEVPEQNQIVSQFSKNVKTTLQYPPCIAPILSKVPACLLPTPKAVNDTLGFIEKHSQQALSRASNVLPFGTGSIRNHPIQSLAMAVGAYSLYRLCVHDYPLERYVLDFVSSRAFLGCFVLGMHGVYAKKFIPWEKRNWKLSVVPATVFLTWLRSQTLFSSHPYLSIVGSLGAEALVLGSSSVVSSCVKSLSNGVVSIHKATPRFVYPMIAAGIAGGAWDVLKSGYPNLANASLVAGALLCLDEGIPIVSSIVKTIPKLGKAVVSSIVCSCSCVRSLSNRVVAIHKVTPRVVYPIIAGGAWDVLKSGYPNLANASLIAGALLCLDECSGSSIVQNMPKIRRVFVSAASGIFHSPAYVKSLFVAAKNISSRVVSIAKATPRVVYPIIAGGAWEVLKSGYPNLANASLTAGALLCLDECSGSSIVQNMPKIRRVFVSAASGIVHSPAYVKSLFVAAKNISSRVVDIAIPRFVYPKRKEIVVPEAPVPPAPTTPRRRVGQRKCLGPLSPSNSSSSAIAQPVVPQRLSLVSYLHASSRQPVVAPTSSPLLPPQASQTASKTSLVFGWCVDGMQTIGRFIWNHKKGAVTLGVIAYEALNS